jgi:hypothetical protein
MTDKHPKRPVADAAQLHVAEQSEAATSEIRSVRRLGDVALNDQGFRRHGHLERFEAPAYSAAAILRGTPSIPPRSACARVRWRVWTVIVRMQKNRSGYAPMPDFVGSHMSRRLGRER